MTEQQNILTCPVTGHKVTKMKTYNEIMNDILNMPARINAVRTTTHTIVHSDGLHQSHNENIYGEQIISIRREIWQNNSLTLQQKQELNEAYTSKLAI